MHVSHANRLSQRVDLPEFPQFILEKITANGADFADGFLVAVALWATAQVLFLRQHGASHSEAATVKESAKRQVQARCAAVVQDAAKHRRLARRHLEAWARLAAELCRVALR
jgi:4-hydroxy-3-methylbut-2-enyl diphosphate reductase IspH